LDDDDADSRLLVACQAINEKQSFPCRTTDCQIVWTDMTAWFENFGCLLLGDMIPDDQETCPLKGEVRQVATTIHKLKLN
jgi:hypothetical protein